MRNSSFDTTRLNIEALSFRNDVLKYTLGALTIALCPLLIWCSSVHSPLTSKSWKFPPPAAKRAVKFTKSLITQPRVAFLLKFDIRLLS